jgi:hypothetical protein
MFYKKDTLIAVFFHPVLQAKWMSEDSNLFKQKKA